MATASPLRTLRLGPEHRMKVPPVTPSRRLSSLSEQQRLEYELRMRYGVRTYLHARACINRDCRTLNFRRTRKGLCFACVMKQIVASGEFESLPAHERDVPPEDGEMSQAEIDERIAFVRANPHLFRKQFAGALPSQKF